MSPRPGVGSRRFNHRNTLYIFSCAWPLLRTTGCKRRLRTQPRKKNVRCNCCAFFPVSHPSARWEHTEQGTFFFFWERERGKRILEVSLGPENFYPRKFLPPQELTPTGSYGWKRARARPWRWLQEHWYCQHRSGPCIFSGNGTDHSSFHPHRPSLRAWLSASPLHIFRQSADYQSSEPTLAPPLPTILGPCFRVSWVLKKSNSSEHVTKLYNTTISTDPQEDIRLKTFVMNKNLGIAEKKYNNKTLAKLFIKRRSSILPNTIWRWNLPNNRQ